jgi:hypothetical protein
VTDSRTNSIQPRPEAVPLGFSELTAEQRKAGEQAVRLLRGMALEQGKAPVPQSTQHSYLPVIYKEHRGNRVVLLDGARGSGKSALLITLLDGYSTALLEQRAPEGYSSWLSPADRIVPVGLVDLQPLAPSTNLLFHLLANLERVVEAMELRQDQPRLGTAAWNPGSENESASRKAWRNFVRVAASGWKDNLEARKGMLDAEAFAVEVEQGELQRLDLSNAFRELMDALVQDYRAWNHWQAGPPPLFLIAVDDADMNPDLTEQLLDLVRKLWHPRLAFLLSGHSDLFINTLTKSRQELGPAVYEKAIPVRHRCQLPELSPQQRLDKAPPSLGEILKQFPLPKPGHPSRPSGTLADYFALSTQVREVLPGRLRALWELSFQLESLASATEEQARRSASDEAVAFIWNWSLDMTPMAPTLRERLESMVRVKGTKRELKLDSDFELEWATSELLQALDTGQMHLELGRQLRAEASIGEAGGNTSQPLDSLVTSALLLATNFIADAERLGANLPKLPSGLSVILAGATLKQRLPDGPTAYAWPIPEWQAPLDITLLGDTWAQRVSTMNASLPQAAEDAARNFLRTILFVGLGQEPAGKAEASSWHELAANIASTARLRTAATNRQRLLGKWALGRAGLLAAPESGLPASTANALLEALKDAFQTEWETARQELRTARLKRAELAFQLEREKAPTPNAMEDFLQELDQQFPEHQFRRLVEAPDDAAVPAPEFSSDFRQLLESIQLPALSRILGDASSHSLAQYLTPLRREWLQRASPHLLHVTQEELSLFTKIQDAGAPALVNLWKTWCEAADEPELSEALLFQNGQLVISKDVRRLLDAKREQPEPEPGLLRFGSRGRLECGVQVPRSALKPVPAMDYAAMAGQPLEAVLRMAYDHGQDLGEPAKSEDVQPVGWKGVRFQFKKFRPLRLWSVPRWPSLFEWEFLEQSWAEAERLALGAGGSGLSRPSPKLLDGLAYWLMSVCQDLQSRHELSQHFKLEPTLGDWQVLITGYGRPRFEGKEVRPHLYKPWRRLLPLLATPEAGLSDNAATAIVGFISGQRDGTMSEWDALASRMDEKKKGTNLFSSLRDASVDMEDWKKESKLLELTQLRVLRKQRLLAAGVEEGEVDELLVDIDNTFPNHPWVKVFGPWGGQPRLPVG